MARIKKKADPSEKQKAKRKECKKLSMRKAREKLKQNPVLLEEARRKDRERKKEQRKKINDMSNRDQRNQRKKWRQYSKTYRENVKTGKNLEMMLDANTPSPSPALAPSPSTSRVTSGKKVRRKERRILNIKLRELENKNKELQKQVQKYRKRAYRLQKFKETTPHKKTREILQGQKCRKEVRKSLLFGEVIKNQIQKNFSKETNLQKKRYFARFISGKILKKYKMMSQITKITSRRAIKYNPHSGNEIKKRLRVRRAIQDFLELDENSRLCPGKKDTITVKKKKMQKRLLNDNLKNLHKKFVRDISEYKQLSYSMFCKLRPYWIVFPNCRDRETCLCKIHSNMSLIVTKLHSLKIISESNPDEILKNITCGGKMDEKCLEKQCVDCNEKDIKYHAYVEGENVRYNQWVDKKIEIKGENKIAKKTIKEEIHTTKNELVSQFKTLLPKFACHISNIKHQYKSIDFIKKGLRVGEVLLHMDFSENYNCKYAEEVQSMHFGGSRNQVSLHTSVLYYNKEGSIQSVPFGTLSKDCRHNNVAICAHLTPVIKQIKNIVPNFTTIHFVSDGPSSQYRNKKMFLLAVTYLAQLASVNTLHWHFLEAGHGKGAPDGVGGCLKRIADGIVSKGVDIPDIDVLVKQLKENCTGVHIFHVPETQIDEIHKIEVQVPPFVGTLRTHEISWSKDKDDIIDVRRLTCTLCLTGQRCHHYSIGQILIKRHDFSSIFKEQTVNEKKSDENIKDNDYVVVKLAGKKTFRYYIALIVSCDCDDLGFSVKFMKKISADKFIFENEKVWSIEMSDVIGKLDQPLLNNRDQYTFQDIHKFDVPLN